LVLWLLRRLDGDIVAIRKHDGVRITGTYDLHSVDAQDNLL
jgi:hypothetical protein